MFQMRNCCGQTSELLTNICQQSSEILRSEEEFEHKEEQMLMELIGHRKQMINKMKQMEVVYEEVVGTPMISTPNNYVILCFSSV